MAEGSERESSLNDDGSKIKAGLVVTALVAVALLLFVAQNTDKTEVTWLFFDGDFPLWLLIIVAAVLGGVLTEVGGWILRRRRRNN